MAVLAVHVWASMVGQAVVAEDLHVGWEMIALKHFKGFGAPVFKNPLSSVYRKHFLLLLLFPFLVLVVVVFVIRCCSWY